MTRRPRAIPGVSAPSARQGLTSDQIAHQIEAQGGRCFVCRDLLGPEFAADHSHRLAELHGHDPRVGCRLCFRGILCKGCNLMLGWARDRPEVLERGADYLRAAGDG